MAIDLKPIFEEVKDASGPTGTITIAKNASNREKFLSFFKSLLKDKKGSEEPNEKQVFQEMAPPGREKQVKKLKKLIKKGGKKGGIPKSYKAKGKTKKSNPFAIAWAQHNKPKEEAKEKDPRDEPEEETPQYSPGDEDGGTPHPPGVKTPGQGGEQEPPEQSARKQKQTSTTGEAEPGKIPPTPKTEPELWGPDVEIFETDYKNIEFGNYQLELRRKVNPNGTVKAEMIFWETSGGKIKRGEKPENLKFHSSVIIEFPDKTRFQERVEHWRWQLGRFNDDIKSRPE